MKHAKQQQNAVSHWWFKLSLLSGLMCISSHVNSSFVLLFFLLWNIYACPLHIFLFLCLLSFLSSLSFFLSLIKYFIVVLLQLSKFPPHALLCPARPPILYTFSIGVFICFLLLRVFLIYLLIMLLQLSHFPPFTPLHPAHPSLPHSPPIVHVHGSYI